MAAILFFFNGYTSRLVNALLSPMEINAKVKSEQDTINDDHPELIKGSVSPTIGPILRLPKMTIKACKNKLELLMISMVPLSSF